MGRECQNLRNHLVAYLYDEVPEPNASRLREHLSLCPSCTEELDSLYRTRETVEWYRLSTPIEPLADEFPETVMERIRKDESPRRNSRALGSTGWMMAAAAALVLAAIVALTLPMTESSDSAMDASMGLGVGSIHLRGSATSTADMDAADEGVMAATESADRVHIGP